MVKNTVKFLLHLVISDDNGNFIILVCDLNDTTYTLVNIYAPNIAQLRFLTTVVKKVKPIQQGHLIVGGDFNGTLETFFRFYQQIYLSYALSLQVAHRS